MRVAGLFTSFDKTISDAADV